MGGAIGITVPSGAAGSVGWAGVARILALTLAGALLVVAGYWLVVLLTDPNFAAVRGVDYAIYHDAAARWLAGGPFYWPEQAAGPYEVVQGHVLYPPVALLLFVPFVHLPAVLWWAVPITIVGAFVVSMRPGPWALAAIAACLAWPVTVELLVTGNPVIWVVAALAMSLRWSWVGVLVLIKPSLFPFALGGLRSRSWWAALCVFGIVCLGFMPMWSEWVAVVTNARGPFSGPFYSLKDLPIMLIPVFVYRSLTNEGQDVPAIAP